MPNSDSRGGECHVATVSSPVEWDSNSLAIRKDMVILPPPYADMGSHRWTALYLVTPPLPAEIPAVRFDITSHDQGWCSDPQSGVWSWFEVSILRPITQDVNATRDHVPQITDLKSCPEDFTEVLQAQGLFFRTLPTNDEPGPGLHQVTQPLVRNRINRAWQSHTIIWRVGNLSEDGEGLLDLVQSGDRLAVWARAEVN
ncbi:hypothetical protein N7456_007411 [Penicillium angulare]|uniref:Uncharacterized protein n=1 Tax=Penicillium angulare TaxID=116970 RepID=A0A9W9K8D9_9EURO|nr:hypothetical protein N7456_007411 [Penicillium angulare]